MHVARLVRAASPVSWWNCVEAARAGAGDTAADRSLLSYPMPFGLVIVAATPRVAGAILAESYCLKEFGYGVQPPDADLGQHARERATGDV